MKTKIIFNERLSELMQEQNLSANSLAKNLDVNFGTVHSWKHGETLLSLSQLIKLANYFNCSLDFLIGRSDKVLDFTPNTCSPFYQQLRNKMKELNVSRNKIHN